VSNCITKDRVARAPGDETRLKIDVLAPAPLTASEFSIRMEDLPIDTPSLINRDTEEKFLKKILKSRGGFDGGIWQPPRAGRVKSTGEVYIFDGDHSKHLFILANPDATTMPVQVIDVESKRDIHRLFVQTNNTCKTPISSEQIFVHNVHAGDLSVVKYEDACTVAGLKVYCSNEPGGLVGDSNGTEIKFGDLKVAFHSATDMDILLEAKELIMKCINPLGTKNLLPGPMFRSLCILFSAYPNLRLQNECGLEFENFFLESVGNKTPERFGKIVERDCRSGFAKSYRMAAGLIQEISDYQKDSPGTFKAVSKGAQSRIMMSDLKRYGDKKRGLQGNRSKKKGSGT
tara:strand:+ start:14607 stop:15641 length:1035 start_codon:yes stop_codon:yes gene_type:complete